ncbi:MAG: hypothetical protein IT452_03745 [Planctomycetia bacterium]|nr:hypothetical protein [Planctomycetia bacterium]
MSLPAYLNALREHGRAKVDPPRPIGKRELDEALSVLRAMDAEARAEAPAGAPPLAEAVALWAAGVAYGASQALVFRHLDAEVVKTLVAIPAPPCADGAAAAWSADLTLRILPDLVGLARGVSDKDPLIEAVLALARAWPLSSVGVRGLDGVAPGAAAEHPALLRIYADRVLERRDLSRLADPRVREAVREALGAHPELCEEVARAAEVTA